MEYYHRYEDGELESADSIKLVDSLKYRTPGGKIVYGGGGIMPDIFIPLENGKQLTFYNESVNKGILYQFAFDYTDQHRSEFNKYRNFKAFDAGFSVSQALFNEYVAYAAKNGIHPGQGEIAPSMSHIMALLEAYIARNLYDNEGFYPIYLRTDKGFERALKEVAR